MVRAKFRYIVLNITPLRKKSQLDTFSVKHTELYRALLLMVKNMHGDFGLASIKTGFTAKYCNDVTKVAIVKIRHGPHRLISTVIPFVTKLADTTVRFHTLFMTATLRQAYKYLKRHQQLQLERLTQQWTEDGNLKLLEEKCLDLKTVEDFINREKKEP